MTDTDLSLRRLTLTMIVAFLTVIAGCTTGIGGDPIGSDAAEENSETPEEITPEDGQDLRTISFDEQFGEVEKQGELDGGDPQQNNKVYEPVVFVGHEGRYYNITMGSYFGAEEMRLIDPDGEVVAVAAGDSDTPAELDVQLNKTGNYTVEATSVAERETFTYTLTVNEVAFAGSAESWGEYERYFDFASYSEAAWEEQIDFSNATVGDINTSENYVVVEYKRGENDNETVLSTYTAVMARTIIEVRDFMTEDLERENPDEWFPDRIYFKGYNEDGELVETTYVSQRWTTEYMAGGNEETRKYFYRIAGTTRYGPAHLKYSNASENMIVTEDTFPYPAYNESYEDFPTG